MSEEQTVDMGWTSEELGLVIRIVRNQLRIQQSDLADIVGVSERTIGRWESEGVPRTGLDAQIIRQWIIDNRELVHPFLVKRSIGKKEAGKGVESLRKKMARRLAKQREAAGESKKGRPAASS